MNYELGIKKILVVANWKCNPTTLKGAKLLLNAVKKGIKNIKNTEVVICPPFPYLSIINNQLSIIKLGAQDCFWEQGGAFTGEISPLMLKDLGCEYVIVGHSERRRELKETDEMISEKIKAALNAELKPILCIGETEKERKAGKTFKVLKNQLKKALSLIPNSKFLIPNLIVAYEPVWAVGSGNPCEPSEAKKVNLFLRKLLAQTPIIYGGSANSENAADYTQEAGFQGLLVGGASLNAKEFIKIVKNVGG